MELVTQLIIKFHRRKGIWPIDEEVLIEFALSERIGEMIPENQICSMFANARQNAMNTIEDTETIESKNLFSLEPLRPPTPDEILLYEFFGKYCSQNNITESWIADWAHVRRSPDCVAEIDKLIDKYMAGEIGTIPHCVTIFGGDHICRDFVWYTRLDDDHKWNKFFCAGLSRENILHILKRRSRANPSMEKRGLSSIPSLNSEVVHPARERFRAFAHHFPNRSRDFICCKFLLTLRTLPPWLECIPTDRVLCARIPDISDTNSTIITFSVPGRRMFTMRQLVLSCNDAPAAPLGQLCVLDDSREFRLGPVRADFPTTLKGTMFCTDTFSVVCSQNILPKNLEVQVDVLCGELCPDEWALPDSSSRIQTSTRLVGPLSPSNIQPRQSPAAVKQAIPVSANSGRRFQESKTSLPRKVRENNSNVDTLNTGRKTRHDRLEASQLSPSDLQPNVSLVLEVLQESLNRSRACPELLENGNCLLGSMCPNCHP